MKSSFFTVSVAVLLLLTLCTLWIEQVNADEEVPTYTAVATRHVLFPGVLNVSWELRHHASGKLIPAASDSTSTTTTNLKPEDIAVEVTMSIVGDWWGGFGFCDYSTEGTIFTCYVPENNPGRATCQGYTGKDFDVFPLEDKETATVHHATIDKGRRCDFVSSSHCNTEHGQEIITRRNVVFSFRMDKGTVGGTKELKKGSGETRAVVAYAKWNMEKWIPNTHTRSEQYDVLKVNLHKRTLTPFENEKYYVKIAVITCLVILGIFISGSVAMRHTIFFAQPRLRQLSVATLGVVYALLLTLYIAMNMKDYSLARKSIPFGRACGDGAVFVLCLLLYPVTKNVGLGPLINMGTEKLIRYHVAMAVTLVTLVVIHGVGMLRLYAVAPNNLGYEFMLSFHGEHGSNVAGPMAFAFLVIIATPALLMRRRFFAFFRYTHSLFFAFIACAIGHYPRMLIALCIPLVCYGVELLIRRFTSLIRDPELVDLQCLVCDDDDEGCQAPTTTNSSGAAVLILDVRVNQSANLPMPQPGQYAYIGVAEIGPLMHPFTIVSFREAEDDERGCPTKDGESVYVARFIIKVMGDGSWTHQLAQFADHTRDPNKLRALMTTVGVKTSSKMRSAALQLNDAKEKVAKRKDQVKDKLAETAGNVKTMIQANGEKVMDHMVHHSHMDSIRREDEEADEVELMATAVDQDDEGNDASHNKSKERDQQQEIDYDADDIPSDFTPSPTGAAQEEAPPTTRGVPIEPANGSARNTRGGNVSSVLRNVLNLHLSWTGPYGRLTCPLDQCKSVLLIAGGIGVTPHFSFLRQIAAGCYPNVSVLRLVWSVRSLQLLTVVAQELVLALEQLVKNNSNAVPANTIDLDITVHITKKSYGDGNSSSPTSVSLRRLRETVASLNGGAFCSTAQLSILNGRPNFENIVNETAEVCREPPIGVFCCGPRELKADVTKAAGVHSSKMYLHTETFEL